MVARQHGAAARFPGRFSYKANGHGRAMLAPTNPPKVRSCPIRFLTRQQAPPDIGRSLFVWFTGRCLTNADFKGYGAGVAARVGGSVQLDKGQGRSLCSIAVFGGQDRAAVSQRSIAVFDFVAYRYSAAVKGPLTVTFSVLPVGRVTFSAEMVAVAFAAGSRPAPRC